MRFRLGLALGIGIGYVLGTKAGRETYDDLVAFWDELRSSQTARQIEGSLRGVAATAREEFGQELDR